MKTTPYASLLKLFLHVNRDSLTAWQRMVIDMVLHEDSGPDELAGAILAIDQHVEALQVEEWEPERRTTDMVNQPIHYARMPMEPTYFLGELRSLGFDLCWTIENFLKYVCRYRFKNGIEDLRKASRNLAMEIKRLDGDPKWSL